MSNENKNNEYICLPRNHYEIAAAELFSAICNWYQKDLQDFLNRCSSFMDEFGGVEGKEINEEKVELIAQAPDSTNCE
ncbi:MAG: hypothetical protein KA998_00645 [Rickettsiaceae bacterium]|nr:hypothetical protein [Rickettsiaceae bacterium]